MKILEPLVDRPLPVFLLTFLIAVMGIYSLMQLPVKRTPEIEIPYSFIVVPYPGATPEDVEAEISVELEEQLMSIDGLRHFHGYSGMNAATVFLEFEDRTDMTKSLRDVRNGVDLAEAEFPSEAEAGVVHELSMDHFPIVMFTLSGGGDLYRLREIAEKLKPSLEAVEGVRTVDIFGGFEPEVRVHAEPARLAQFDLTLEDLSAKIRRQSRAIPTGELSTSGSEHTIRATGEFNTLEEIRSITVANEPAGPISLRDVAEVKLGHLKRTNGAWIDGEESVTLIVRRRPVVNTLEAVRELKRVVEEKRSSLPPGVRIQVTSDATTEIGDMIRQLGTSAAWGMALVVVVLLVVFGVRQSLLVASVLPFSLLFTFIGLYLFDMEISNIALFALILVLGLVVDGAIIMGEAIFVEREAGARPVSASKRGLRRVGTPVIAADLTTVAAYVPMLMMVGIMGQFMSIMPWVVIFALTGSVFIDHVFIPAAAARMSRSGRGRQKAPQFSWIREPYLRGLDWALDHRRRIVAASTAAFVGAILLFTTGAVPTIFIPTTDHSRVWVKFELPLGTPIEETDRIGELISQELAQIAEVKSYLLTTGDTGALNSNPAEGSSFGPEYGKLNIELQPRKERSRSQDEIVEDVRQRMKRYAGVKISIDVMTDGPPVGAALTLLIRGHDLEQLAMLGRDLERRIGALPGARDLRLDYDDGKSEVRVKLDRARAASDFGISPDQVSRSLLTAFHGEEVGRMWVGSERVDIRLRAPDGLPYTVDTLRELPLRSDRGEIVPLGAVAEIGLGFTHDGISRKDGMRTVTLRGANAPGTSSIELEKQVREMLAAMSIPGDVDVVFRGESEERDRSFRSLFNAFWFAAALIYLIIAVQFNSLKQPLIVLCTVPLSLVGVALGLFTLGYPLSFNCVIGIVSLTGIVVNDAIVMVDAINHGREEGMPLREALMDAGRRRFRPVVLTTVTTIAGLLPLTLSIAEGAEFWTSLGITIISGLLVASLMTLFVVPVLYSLLYRVRPSRIEIQAAERRRETFEDRQTGGQQRALPAAPMTDPG